MDERVCTIEGCGKRAPSKGGGLCSMHRRRKERHGDPLAPVRSYERQSGPCQADGCERAVKAKGLCHAHYQRLQRTGDPGGSLRTPRPSCSFDDCDRPHRARGFCDLHYQRAKSGRPLDAPVQVKTQLPERCSFQGCDSPPRARGLCTGHYHQALYGDGTLRPKKQFAPRGSGWVNDQGYRMFGRDGRTWAEHRWNAEQALDRPLLPTEEIHHINGNRLDNRVDGPFVMDRRGRLRSGNLEIWSTSQPKGQEIGPKVDWARSILALYGDEGERERYVDRSPV